MEENKFPPALPFPPADPIDLQHDDELWPWCEGVTARAGDFLKTIVEAARRADPENYAIMRPLLLQFREKYPEYHLVGLDLAKTLLNNLGLYPYGAKGAKIVL